SVSIALENYLASLPEDDPLSEFLVCLEGGDPQRGESIFLTHPAAQCLRCHRAGKGQDGGDAGPNLAGIGKRQNARYLLESLILPNATVAPGFGIISLTFANGASKSGILSSEDADTLDLLEGRNLWRIKKNAIRDRTSPVSAMAPMHALLSKYEIRDLVAWLGSLSLSNPSSPSDRTPIDLDPDTLLVNTPGNEQNPSNPAEKQLLAEGQPEPSEKTSILTKESPPEPSPEEKAESAIDPRQMQIGKEAYLTCIACHGDRGQGVPGQGGPPLAPSEWVVGPVENLIRIQMRGLKDNITVNHRQYTLGVDINPAGMIPLPSTNEQIAAVLTYIRNNWGNRASPVTPDMVEQYRDEIGKPPLKVADLIPPPPLPRPEATQTPLASAPPAQPGLKWMKTALITLGVVAWCGLCAIPIIRQFKSGDKTPGD
ncbi:MAG: c-type cytochrome, partial [Verrucomicrobiota bacterium]|nr:c-type cytochrome [Verrucomicrobiota bacterium]